MKKEVKINSSNLTKLVYNIVNELYPNEGVKQEETIRIDGKTLYLDIYIPRLKIAIECNGEQHFKFNKFFHTDAGAFMLQKKNDLLKELYCQETNIALAKINYNDNITKDLVKQRIIESLRK